MTDKKPKDAKPNEAPGDGNNNREADLQDDHWELLRLRVQKELSEHFDIRLKEDRAFVKTVLGWAAGVVSVVFLLLGIKTLKDMDIYIKDTVHEKISQKLNYEDPRSLSSVETEHIFVRAIVNSYALTRAKARVAEQPFEMQLPDLNRLLAWLKNENCSDDEFEDILSLIENSWQYNDESQNSRSTPLPIYSAFWGMLSPDAMRKSYLKDRPDRQARLIRSTCFMEKCPTQLMNLLLDVLHNPASEECLLRAAIYGIGKYGGKADEALLMELAQKSEEASVKEDVLNALASLNPESDYISKWVAAFRAADGLGNFEARFVVDFAVTLYENLVRTHSLTDATLDDYRTALLLLSSCIDKGIRFKAVSNPWGDELVILDTHGNEMRSVDEHFDLLANKSGAAPIHTIYILLDTLQFEMNDFKSTGTLNQQIALIEKYSIFNRDDVESMFQKNQQHTMLVQLTGASMIRVHNSSLTSGSTHAMIPIKLEIDDNKQLKATWKNKLGTVQDSDTVTAMIHPESMRFGYRFKQPEEKLNRIWERAGAAGGIRNGSAFDGFLYSHSASSSKK